MPQKRASVTLGLTNTLLDNNKRLITRKFKNVTKKGIRDTLPNKYPFLIIITFLVIISG